MKKRNKFITNGYSCTDILTNIENIKFFKYLNRFVNLLRKKMKIF